jgi:hypothetical protein
MIFVYLSIKNKSDKLKNKIINKITKDCYNHYLYIPIIL